MTNGETGNILLDALPQVVRDEILSAATLTDLPIRTPLAIAGAIPEYIHFLTGGLTSVVIRMEEGGSAEVGMCGKEGIVGSTALLGPMPEYAESFMQITGSGLRIPMDVAREFFETLPDFRRIVLAYVQEQMIIATQTAGCNRLHEALPRLARWMLMVSDRIQSNTLGLTQDFIAQMLGTQRSTVVLVAGQLQETGAIAYSRGVVRIVDRPLLEKRACECYAVTRRTPGSLINNPSTISRNGHSHEPFTPLRSD
jgi:CRP-like cAMP-binding protein